jgi:hypothetical protein
LFSGLEGEFAEYLPQVKVDGRAGDVHTLADLIVGGAQGDQSGHPAFGFGETRPV